MKLGNTALALCLLSATAIAEDDGRALVDHFINDVQTLSSRFEQSLLDPNGTLLESSSGTLEISRPGQFRWAYDEPYEQWLVADGLNIWSYDVDLAQVIVKPQAEALASTPALLLGGAPEVMDAFEVNESFEESGLSWVRMSPVDTESGFQRVDLGFLGDSLSRMVFLDNLEQTTIVLLADVAINEDIDPARFEFSIPDDVDVVGTPVTAANDEP